MYGILARQRDGGELSRAEIDRVIEGAVAGTIPDYQLAALLMAIFCRGLSPRETADLTLADGRLWRGGRPLLAARSNRG